MDIIEIKGLEEFNNKVNSGKTVLVDFYATWCMPCKMMSPIIDKIAKEHNDIVVMKVNVDNNQDLAVKYNIMSIPTIMIFRNGNPLKSFVGVTDENEIVADL